MTLMNLINIDDLIGKIKTHNLSIGFIDPKGKIKDPANFIFRGLFDYIGKGLIKKILQSGRINILRIESAVNFRKNQLFSIVSQKVGNGPYNIVVESKYTTYIYHNSKNFNTIKIKKKLNSFW